MNVFDENFQLASNLGADGGNGSYLFSVLSSLIQVVKNCQQRLDEQDSALDDRIARMENIMSRAEARVNSQSTTVREEVRAAEERIMHAMNRRIDLITDGLDRTMASHQDATKATAALDASLTITTKRIDALAQAVDPSARIIAQLKDDMEGVKGSAKEAIRIANENETTVKRIDASHSTALRTLHNAVNQRFGGVEDAAQRQAQLFREMLLTQADAIARQTADVRGAVQRAVGSLEAAHGDLAGRVNSDLVTMRDAMTDGLEALGRDVGAARDDARDAVAALVRRLDSTDDRIESVRHTTTHALGDLEAALRALRGDEEDTAAALRDTTARVGAQQTALEALRVAQREAAEDSKSADARASALTEDIRDIRRDLKDSQSSLVRRLETAEEQLSGARNNITAVEATADALRERLAALRGDVETSVGVVRDATSKLDERLGLQEQRTDMNNAAVERLLEEIGMRQARDGHVFRDEDDDPLHVRVGALSEVSELAAQRIADLVDAHRAAVERERERDKEREAEKEREREAKARKRRGGGGGGYAGDSDGDDEWELRLQRERVDALVRGVAATLDAKASLITSTVADVAARVASWLDVLQSEGGRDGTSVLIERVAELETMRTKVDRIRDIERRVVAVERTESRVEALEGDLDALDGAVRLLNQLAGGIRTELGGLAESVDLLHARGGRVRREGDGRGGRTSSRVAPSGHGRDRSPSDALR